MTVLNLSQPPADRPAKPLAYRPAHSPTAQRMPARGRENRVRGRGHEGPRRPFRGDWGEWTNNLQPRAANQCFPSLNVN